MAARAADDPALEAAALTALGRHAVVVAAKNAAASCEVALVAAREVGEPILLADALLTAAGARERAHSWDHAEALADEALELFRAEGDPYGAAWALAELGWYDLVHGRLDEAESRLGEALELRRRHGDDRRLVEPLIDHAWLMLARERGEEATLGFLDCLGLPESRRRPVQRRRGARRPLDPGGTRGPLVGQRPARGRVGRAARTDRRATVGVGHRDRGARACRRQGSARKQVPNLRRRGPASCRSRTPSGDRPPAHPGAWAAPTISSRGLCPQEQSCSPRLTRRPRSPADAEAAGM